MRCAGPHCEIEVVPTGSRGPAPAYCSGRCRQRAYKRRLAEAAGCELPKVIHARAPRLAPADERVAVAVLEAERISGALIHLGAEAPPRLAWRCLKVGEVIGCAIDDYFEGVL